MKTYIYLLFISLLLFTFVIIPIKCASRKDDSVPESSNKPDSGPSTSSLNPLAKEFKPYNDHLSHYQFDDPHFSQFLPQNIMPTGSCDFDKYFPTFSQNIDPEGINFPAYDGRVFNTGFWDVPNQSEKTLNHPEKQFITDFDPEGIIYNISTHFDEFGWPEEEKFLSDDKFLMGINFLSEKANWILEIVSHKNKIKEGKITEKYTKFGHYFDKKMLKTFELLDRYARCVAKWNKRNIITITGPISVLVSEKIEKKGSIKCYPFNKEVKHPPINQIFKVIITEYEYKKYCADILFTDANWNEDTKFEKISKENCGKDHLNSNWDYKNYIKDYKIMGELFKNKLEFLEWYIGFELIDLLQNAGFDNIKKLGTI